MIIQPALLQFLKEVQQNNNREWFGVNKERYVAHQAFMKAFLANIQHALEKHDLIEKAKLYRIYRDVRFSKDKSPYKTYFGGWFKRATKERRGGYYFHIEPGKTVISGGFWRPNPTDLKRIRQEFAASDTTIRAILSNKDFQKKFGLLQGEAVKTSPRGFDKKHPSMDLIGKKQFIVQRSFTDAAVLQTNFLDEIVLTFLSMRPFFDYMSDILTTDGNGLPIE